MTDEATSLTGVVEPEELRLPGMPEDREQTPFEVAHGNAVQALALTDEKLRNLRKHRDETEAEIKQLVDEKNWLERMVRAPKGRKKD